MECLLNILYMETAFSGGNGDTEHIRRIEVRSQVSPSLSAMSRTLQIAVDLLILPYVASVDIPANSEYSSFDFLDCYAASHLFFFLRVGNVHMTYLK